jgi:hypothetical protein
MDSNPRRHRRANPEIDPAPAPDDPDGFPPGPDAAEAGETTGPWANGQPDDDGRPAGPAGIADDIYDLESLRLGQDFGASLGVKRRPKTIPVRKPSKEWFVRVHPDPAYRIETKVLELKEDRETYIVGPSLRPELESEPTVSSRLLIAAISRQGTLFVWPIRLPGPDGKLDDWSRSALAAAEEARARWVRIAADMQLGAYDVTVATGRVVEPDWPDLTFQEIIKIAFRDRVITDWDHPVLRRLRGEA